MDPGNFDNELRHQDLVDWCIADRDRLRKEFLILRPQHHGRPPALWLEELLGTLGYRVCFLPMEQGQMGLCDVANRHIFINSRVDARRTTGREAQHGKTLAHELAHARLHEREMQEQADGHTMSRRRPRENEAEVYASIFLISRAELEKDEAVLEMLETRRHKEPMESRALWVMVYRLAETFCVSATMMMECLVDLGWLRKAPSRQRGRKTDLELNWRMAHD